MDLKKAAKAAGEKNIEMIANDKMHFGGLGGCGKAGQSPLPVSLGGPHILVKDVLIGGKQ